MSQGTARTENIWFALFDEMTLALVIITLCLATKGSRFESSVIHVQ